MKKENINFWIITGITIAILGTIWIVYTGITDTLDGRSEEEYNRAIDEFSFIRWASIFFPTIAGICILMSIKRNKKKKGCR